MVHDVAVNWQCEHGRVHTACGDCRHERLATFLTELGPVQPHGLAEWIPQRFELREAWVERHGEGGPVPSLPRGVERRDYWFEYHKLYPGGSCRSELWQTLRALVLDRDGHVCSVCGAPDGLQVDHILPLSKGGRNSFRNLWTLCDFCHSAKTGRPLGRAWFGDEEDFRQEA